VALAVVVAVAVLVDVEVGEGVVGAVGELTTVLI
jgi:hypothetical protein